MMVIEPEVLIRMMIAEFLRECGYRVMEGVAARDLWAAIDSNIRPDIVFCEVHLAGQTDGYTLARTLRQTHPQIEVILTSETVETAARARDPWDNGLIRKPYEAADVAARVRALLQRRGTGKP